MEINNTAASVTGQQDRNTISLDLMNRMKLYGHGRGFPGKSGRHHSAVHDRGHVPFHASCTRMGLSCLGCHNKTYQKCRILLQGLSRTD